MLTGSMISIVGLPVFIGFNIGAILGPLHAMNLWVSKNWQNARRTEIGI